MNACGDYDCIVCEVEEPSKMEEKEFEVFLWEEDSRGTPEAIRHAVYVGGLDKTIITVAEESFAPESYGHNRRTPRERDAIVVDVNQARWLIDSLTKAIEFIKNGE